MQVATTITSHEAKQINGRNGAFTLHLFKAADGTRFQTTKQEIANVVYGLAFANGQPNMQPITIDLEQVPRGDYLNNEITSALAGAVAGVATSVPGGRGGGGSRGGGGGGFGKKDQAVINRSAALSRAIETVAAGIITPAELGGSDGLFKLANRYVKYIETAPEAQGGAVSSDGGGAPVGAAPTAAPTAAPVAAEAPAAPVAAPPAAPATPDDDIPFLWDDRYGVEPSQALRFHN